LFSGFSIGVFVKVVELEGGLLVDEVVYDIEVVELLV
jgi:hypothetical protein